jgi:two-component system response regulator FixJ
LQTEINEDMSDIGQPPILTELNDGVIHIIDDDRDFSSMLALQFQCAGLSSERYLSAEHFLATYRPRRIECALLDLRMPGMHGLELQNILRERHPILPLIVVSAFGKTPDIVRAVRNGAIDFLEKPIDDHVLLAAVRGALRKDHEKKTRGAHRTQNLALLTDREREVLDLFIEAKSTKQVANLLSISPKTVEKHRAHIFEKLNADSVPALIRLVLEVQV